jgi:hypothetical protein
MRSVLCMCGTVVLAKTYKKVFIQNAKWNDMKIGFFVLMIVD